jgi:hypothetical protein
MHLMLLAHQLLMLRLRDQRGLALPMVIGMMMAFSMTVSTGPVYSS